MRRSAAIALALLLGTATSGLAESPPPGGVSAAPAQPPSAGGVSAAPAQAPSAGGGSAAPRFQDGAPVLPSVEERLAEIARRVQSVAIYPPIARARGQSGEALVEFLIVDQGQPSEVRTRRSSGSVALDRAAERAVHAAAPLPYVFGTVVVPVRFQLAGDD